MTTRKLIALTALSVTLIGASIASAQVKQKGVWTAPKADSIPPAFLVQGEYLGRTEAGSPLGAQVIALGDGWLHVVVYFGGLPGAGWDEKHRILMEGELLEVTNGPRGKVVLKPVEGKRKYMSGKPTEFIPTRDFPPPGHKPWIGSIDGDLLSGKTDGGKTYSLKKTVRRSPTLGAKPPKGAVVLFDGSNLDHWNGGRIEDGVLHTDAKDVTSKPRFKAYSIHVEFMTPFRPKARGQGRGNSGFYQTNGWEVQVLDSFGLEGLKNECGALYGKAAPRINMCLPPLTWQTYDVDLVAADDEDGKSSATLTVRHNGVVIHDKVPTKLGGGNFKLQGHGNLLQYRNIWVIDRSR